ncbi:MAG: hypothetical protein FWF43_05095 [Propionibacteriaceae bacterium]|nr:hypothetical protein [Propionibacteriaceae bacterium]
MDQRAKAILLNTYWQSGQWTDRDARAIPAADFAYAKSKGVMFDLITTTHDELVAQINRLHAEIAQCMVTDAFVASLSTRRLDWRSALASWVSAGRLPIHSFTPYESGQFYEDGKVVGTVHSCIVCRDAIGYASKKDFVNVDLNVLNFERIKWGGVRLGWLDYIWLDLSLFMSDDPPQPTDEDAAILAAILNVVATGQPDDYPGRLRDRLKDVIRSNAAERSALIEALACVGVLPHDPDTKDMGGRHDWFYAADWRGGCRYDREVVARLFGALRAVT